MRGDTTLSRTEHLQVAVVRRGDDVMWHPACTQWLFQFYFKQPSSMLPLLMVTPSVGAAVQHRSISSAPRLLTVPHAGRVRS